VVLEGVTVKRRGRVVLEDVDLTVGERELLAVLGPNGSGKTTLLHVILGLLEPDRGSVRVLGRAPRQTRGRVGYVPQHTAFDRDFPIRVRDVVRMGRIALGGSRRADDERAQALLERMGVAALAQRPIGALSGGELQRVLIARALVSDPELLLLDEPASHLDERMESSLWELIDELSRERSVVLVSHDIGAVSERVRRIACLNRTLFVHEGSELTADVLERVYGGPLTVLAHHEHGGTS
jgi:zinc transport system ATP-binding protein